MDVRIDERGIQFSDCLDGEGRLHLEQLLNEPARMAIHATHEQEWLPPRRPIAHVVDIEPRFRLVHEVVDDQELLKCEMGECQGIDRTLHHEPTSHFDLSNDFGGAVDILCGREEAKGQLLQRAPLDFADAVAVHVVRDPAQERSLLLDRREPLIQVLVDPIPQIEQDLDAFLIQRRPATREILLPMMNKADQAQDERVAGYLAEAFLWREGGQ